MNDQNIHFPNDNKPINQSNYLTNNKRPMNQSNYKNNLNIFKIENNLQETFEKDILRVLISIYYYEKTELKNKKENIFKENENYYLIKSNWIINLKKYYNYQILSKLLDNYKKQLGQKEILLDFNNFEKYIYDIKLYLDENKFNSINKELYKDLTNNKEINAFPFQTEKTNLIYYSKCYIINSRIKEIMRKYIFEGKEFSIKQKKVFDNHNNIFLTYEYNKTMNITVGNLND